MGPDAEKRRSKAGWVALPAIALVALGAVGGVRGFPIAAAALPIGVLLLAVAVVLARRGAGAGDGPVQGRGERRRAFALRLLLLGLLMVPVALLISLVAAGVETAEIFGLPVLIALALAITVGLSGRFFVGAMILGAMLLLFAFMIFNLELQHPESFGNFVPPLWMLVGSATAFAAASVAVVQRRRGTLRPATTVQRALVGAGIALLIAGSAVSWFVSGASRVTAAKARGAPVVEMNDNTFRPNEFDVNEGDVARFYLVNKDSEPHTFTIDDLALDEYIGPRGERLVGFDVPRRTRDDTLELVCVVSGHEDMDGEIRVEPR